MSIEVEVTGDIDRLLKLDKDITFAIASALTKVAKEAQAQVFVALQSEFHIRGKWYEQSNKFGIKVKPATKSDLEAAVYTAADWLVEAEGANDGIKRPHGSHLAVPDVQNTRKGIGNKVGKREKARYLLENTQKTRAFKVKSKSGYTLILQRKGKGKNSYTVTKYIFRDEVKVPHQSAVVEPTIKTVLERFPAIFNIQLKTAIETSRLK
jgi:hypothetical protein